jgi:hypothetical protein
MYNIKNSDESKHRFIYMVKRPSLFELRTKYEMGSIFAPTPISTGSLTFAGSALVFHKIDGQPFNVTYTIDAVAKPLIK